MLLGFMQYLFRTMCEWNLGRQVNFYMNKDDEAEFFDFVRTTGNVSILPYVSDVREFHPLKTPSDPRLGKFSGAVWLINRDVSSNLVVKHVPTQGYYSIDEERSSVIEFTRSAVVEKTIGRGRIWAEFTYLDSESMTLVPKEPEFSKWYDTLAKWIRGRYKRLERLIYTGPGAQKLLSEGFVLKRI